MRFEGSQVGELRRVVSLESSLTHSQTLDESIAALKKQIKELLFGVSCCECTRMAAIPQGAFAVFQVRKNFDRSYDSKFYDEDKESKDNKNTQFNAKVSQEGRELTPLKYNSKLMNSIWGLYNRYSVHNFKQIDANEAGLVAWGNCCINPAEATGKGPVISAGH